MAYRKIDYDTVRKLLTYDPESGKLTWIVGQRNSIVAGRIAGYKTRRGYISIGINKVTYAAHRLAFLLQTGRMPMEQIDHINGVFDDNRWCNLREANMFENMRNRQKLATNKSGYKGVSWSKATGKWYAQIKRNKVCKNLGYFDDPKEAHKAYVEAAIKLHRDFANDGYGPLCL